MEYISTTVMRSKRGEYETRRLELGLDSAAIPSNLAIVRLILLRSKAINLNRFWV
jgi:hypothetical protein